jgi:transposase-like protein
MEAGVFMRQARCVPSGSPDPTQRATFPAACLSWIAVNLTQIECKPLYLAGTNTRRVRQALFGLFDGAVSKDSVSRARRKAKIDREAWCARSLAGEDIVRLILDGTVVKTRSDGRATSIPVLEYRCMNLGP